MKTSLDQADPALLEAIADHINRLALTLFGDNAEAGYYVLLGLALGFSIRAGIKKEEVLATAEQVLLRMEAIQAGGVN